MRNADVARRLNVPAGTVGHWKHPDRARRGECPGAHNPECPRCDDSPLDAQAYAPHKSLRRTPRSKSQGHSDGCRITNWTVRNGKRYEYPRYFFTDKSDDIRQLCTDALAKVGVQWTILARGSDPLNVSIARKASVALMDAHIGPKY